MKEKKNEVTITIQATSCWLDACRRYSRDFFRSGRVVLVHVQTPQLPGKEAVTSLGTVESERIPAIASLTLTEFTIEPTLRVTLFRKTWVEFGPRRQ